MKLISFLMITLLAVNSFPQSGHGAANVAEGEKQAEDDPRDSRARELIQSRFQRLSTNEQSRFHIKLLKLQQVSSTGCGLDTMAEEDCKAGHFNILMAGDTFIPTEHEERMYDYILQKYGIHYFSFRFGGREPRQFYKLLDKYNHVAEREIMKKFKKSNGEIWDEAFKKTQQNKVQEDYSGVI